MDPLTWPQFSGVIVERRVFERGSICSRMLEEEKNPNSLCRILRIHAQAQARLREHRHHNTSGLTH